MSSENNLDKKGLDNILNELRSPKEGKLFTDVVEKNWRKFGFNGNPNPILVENLLIEIIERLYGNQNADQNKDPRDQARRCDISLLTFGLLDGYYHTGDNQGRKKTFSSSVRYNQYLGTNVLVSLDYPGEGTYGEIVVKDKVAHPGKQPRPLNNLTRISGECRAEIGAALLKSIHSGTYKNCSQEAEFDEGTGRRTDLPKPRYTLECFEPKGWRHACGSTPAPTIKPSSASDPASYDEELPPESNKRGNPIDFLMHAIEWLRNRKATFFLFVVIATLAIIICPQIFPPSTIADYPPENGGGIPVEKLTCNPTPVTVYPGDPTALPIKVIPRKAAGVFLYCTSLNEDILYGLDGTEAEVEVIGHYELGDPPVEAKVMVIPQNRATSNVYIEIPIIIDYTKTMQEPR